MRPRAVEGEHEAKEVLNLVGGKDEAALVLREQILNNYFRELEAEDWSGWEPLLGRLIGWKDFAAAIRLSQCRAEAAQNHMESPQWYFMTGELERGGLLPYHPLTDELPLEKQEETLYAVSAPVPVCALWNLLDNKSEEQLPIMTFAEWLKFVQGRSHRDQERLKMIMTRVLLRFRWLDRVGQILYRGWHASYEQRRALERKLEFAIKDLDAARRSGYKVQLMLAHSQTQSRELQAEMIEDCALLQKKLEESESTVEELTSELATRQRL